MIEQGNDRSESYTASKAFSGNYSIFARQAFKTAVGSKAQVKVTMFKGTPKESVEFFTLNLAESKPIEIKLVGGSRNELVMLPDPEPATLTLSPENMTSTGISGGTGTIGSGRAAAATTSMPTVVKPFETKLTGVAPKAPSMRAEASVTPDRKQVRITANPVFATGNEVPMPKVSMLPGGGR